MSRKRRIISVIPAVSPETSLQTYSEKPIFTGFVQDESSAKPLPERSVISIVGMLTPPQLRAFMIALFAILAGTFAFGYKMETYASKAEILKADTMRAAGEAELREFKIQTKTKENDYETQLNKLRADQATANALSSAEVAKAAIKIAELQGEANTKSAEARKTVAEAGEKLAEAKLEAKTQEEQNRLLIERAKNDLENARIAYDKKEVGHLRDITEAKEKLDRLKLDAEQQEKENRLKIGRAEQELTEAQKEVKRISIDYEARLKAAEENLVLAKDTARKNEKTYEDRVALLQAENRKLTDELQREKKRADDTQTLQEKTKTENASLKSELGKLKLATDLHNKPKNSLNQAPGTPVTSGTTSEAPGKR